MKPTASTAESVAIEGAPFRYARLFAALWRNSIVREMQFKLNFVLWIFVEGLWFGLHLAFMSVLYTQTESIAGWSRWQVVLLVGCSHFIQQVFTALFLTNITELSEHIRTGRLDFMLLLPVNTRFLLSVRKVDLGAWVNAASAVAVMFYALHKLGVRPTAAVAAGFLALCGCGLMVHYSLMFLLACISFWTVRAQSIVWGYYNLFNIARLPESAFRGMYKALFTWVFPVLLVANVPAKLLVGKLEGPATWAALVGMGAVCFLVSEWVWRLALRQYTSASS